ncbi:hypothetical protein BK669_04325 [Pseudomonas fluorescens]|nr:hypothetical protein BK669_04325 [Pseudomonas fluorescens]
MKNAFGFWVRWCLVDPLLIEEGLAGQLDIPVRIFGRVIAVHFCNYTGEASPSWKAATESHLPT